MVAAIEGNYAFFGSNTPAWHKLGTVLSDAPTIERAWELAYPFTLVKLPIQATIEGSEETLAVPEHFAIVRSDRKVLGVVGNRHEMKQPFENVDFMRPFIESGLVQLEAGGSLCDGARMWILAKLKDGIADVTPGDTVKSYLLWHDSFDGSLSTGGGFTGTRVVCANTLAQAERNDGAGFFKIRHTKSMHEKIDVAQEIIGKQLAAFQTDVEKYRYLTKKQMTRAQMRAYIDSVLIPAGTPKDKISTKMQTKVLRVVDLIDGQRGLDLVPAIRGTAWQAYNAVSEYLTHEQGRNDDTRLNSQWFGESRAVNQRAFDLALAA